MKKQLKILVIFIIFISIIINLNNVVLATESSKSKETTVTDKITTDKQIKGDAITSAIDKVGTPNANVNTHEITKIGGKIVSIMQITGVVVSVVILVTLGFKYMVGSLEERAEYKKTMIPYLVGALLIGAATTIVRMIYSLITQMIA